MKTPLERIRGALPKGAMVLRQACEAAGFDPRQVLQNPTDDQADAIIAEIYAMHTGGIIARKTAENMAIASKPDQHGDGGRYVRGHTWGDELGTESDYARKSRRILPSATSGRSKSSSGPTRPR